MIAQLGDGRSRDRSARRAVRAGCIAAVVSGLPSTAWAIARAGDVTASTRAAGSLLLPGEQRQARLVAAGAVMHVTLSLAWAAALATLPRRADGPIGATARGAVAGLGIAVVDLGLAHVSSLPRLAGVRSLPLAPQFADHVAYGIVAMLSLRTPAHVWEHVTAGALSCSGRGPSSAAHGGR